jgi:hypothetical protein
MIFNEHLRRADESYELRFNSKGEAIHVHIKDGIATIFPTLDDMIRWAYFGEQTERFTWFEDDLNLLYELDEYEYYKIKRKSFQILFTNPNEL